MYEGLLVKHGRCVEKCSTKDSQALTADFQKLLESCSCLQKDMSSDVCSFMKAECQPIDYVINKLLKHLPIQHSGVK
jgi:hypothetical protein